MKKFTATESAIMDYLCSVLDIIPASINNPSVTYHYSTLTNNRTYGITGPMAQAIRIVSERVGENGEGGILKELETGKTYIV